MRRASLGLFAAGMALSAAGFLSGDAEACGGCFAPSGSESTIVTSHRMALSVSLDRTVLWDQIQYQGSPEEFAWVLPVKPGTIIELASDAFFEALDAATSTRVTPPPVSCPGMAGTQDEVYYYDEEPYPYYGGCSLAGCGSSGGEPRRLQGIRPGIPGTDGTTIEPEVPPVEVVHEESIGPYEAVVLSSNEPGALYDWLAAHGYGIDPSMEPVVDAYEAEAFDFVALRLIPGVNVRQMRPVRVITPGAAPVLPLRMVAAGTGANVAMTLFVLGEGRWEAGNFANEAVDVSQIVWDQATSSSNYKTLRNEALTAGDGWNWLTTYSKPGTLFGPAYDPVVGSSVMYRTAQGSGATSVAGLYFAQGYENGADLGSDPACVQLALTLGPTANKVVDPCAPDVAMGGAGGAGTGGAGGMAMGGSAGSGGVAAGGSAGMGGMATGGSAGMGGMATGGSVGAGGAGGSTGVGGQGVGGAANGGSGGVTNTAGSGGAGGQCDPVAEGEVDAATYGCGELDDLAVGLVGMHPVNVWITRLDANLPKAALAQDLTLAPGEQVPEENLLQASSYVTDPCPSQGLSTGSSRRAKPDRPRREPPFGSPDLLAIGVSLATLLGAAARRAMKKTTRIPS